nr:MAG TPA: ApaG protein [Bacteriophage sp.]
MDKSVKVAGLIFRRASGQSRYLQLLSRYWEIINEGCENYYTN